MANRTARYKDPQTLDVVQCWWDDVTAPPDSFDGLFTGFLESCVDIWGLEYVISQREFEQCIFKLGIQNIATPPAAPIFKQAAQYRPSDTLVERYPS